MKAEKKTKLFISTGINYNDSNKYFLRHVCLCTESKDKI